MNHSTGSTLVTASLACVLAFGSFGCASSNSTQDTATTSASTQSAASTSSGSNTGTIVGNGTQMSTSNRFANSVTGFSYVYPDGFEVLQNNAEADPAQEPILFEASNSEGESIVVTATPGGDNLGSEAFLDVAMQEAEQALTAEGATIEEQPSKLGLTLADGTTLPSIALSASLDGETIYQRQAYTQSGDYTIAVTATSKDKSNLNTILQGIGQ